MKQDMQNFDSAADCNQCIEIMKAGLTAFYTHEFVLDVFKMATPAVETVHDACALYADYLLPYIECYPLFYVGSGMQPPHEQLIFDHHIARGLQNTFIMLLLSSIATRMNGHVEHELETVLSTIFSSKSEDVTRTLMTHSGN